MECKLIILGRVVCLKTCLPQDIPESELAAGRKAMSEVLICVGVRKGKSKFLNSNFIKDLFKEAIGMKNFEHENVMRLIGCSINKELNPEIILPLMDKGCFYLYFAFMPFLYVRF